MSKTHFGHLLCIGMVQIYRLAYVFNCPPQSFYWNDLLDQCKCSDGSPLAMDPYWVFGPSSIIPNSFWSSAKGRCTYSCQCMDTNAIGTIRSASIYCSDALVNTPGSTSFKAAHVPTLPDLDSSKTLLSY